MCSCRNLYSHSSKQAIQLLDVHIHLHGGLVDVQRGTTGGRAVKAEGQGDIGGWGAATGDLSWGPLVGKGVDRMDGYIKQKEIGAKGIVQI